MGRSRAKKDCEEYLSLLNYRCIFFLKASITNLNIEQTNFLLRNANIAGAYMEKAPASGVLDM